MNWTISFADELCGACGVLIVADQPLALLTVNRLIRCRDCAGAPVDENEIDLERWRLAQERTETRVRQEAAAERQPQYAPRVPATRPPLRPARTINRALRRAHVPDPRLAQIPASDRD